MVFVKIFWNFKETIVSFFSFSKNAEPLTNTMINKKHFSYLHWSYQIRFTLKKIYLGAKLGQHIYFGPIPATNTPQDTV